MKRRFRLERQKLTLLNVSSAPGSQLPYLQEKARIEMAGVLETVPGGRTGRRSGPWEERGNCRGAGQENPGAGPKGRAVLVADSGGGGEIGLEARPVRST